MPPITAGTGAGGGGLDQNAGGNAPSSPDGARQGLEAVMGQIRDLGQGLEQIGSQVPALAGEVQQIRQILKRMIVKAAQQTSQQTASSQALPTGG